MNAVWPIDPVSGGTWIGVNDAGIAMVLLNRCPSSRRLHRAGGVSRGTIIPMLLGCRSIESVVDAASDLHFGSFAPFTLVIVQHRMLAALTSVDALPQWQCFALSRPQLFTSSSLGDERVARPRRELFERMMKDSRSLLDGQRAFHRHAWPARPEISVLMSRDDAGTVSRTVVSVDSGAVNVAYTPIAP